MLKLRQEPFSAKGNRMCGSEGYTVDEVAVMMCNAIKEAAGRGAAEYIPK